MKKLRAILSAVLMLTLLTLSACGTEPSDATTVTGSPASEPLDAGELVPTLVLSYEDLPAEYSVLSSMFVSGGRVCISGSNEAGKPKLGLLDGEGNYTSIELPGDVTEVLSVHLAGDSVSAVVRSGEDLCLLNFNSGDATLTRVTGETDTFNGELSYSEKGDTRYIMSTTSIGEIEGNEIVRVLETEKVYELFLSMIVAEDSLYVTKYDGSEGTVGLFELDTEAFVLAPVDTGGAEISGLGRTSGGGLITIRSLDGREYVSGPDGEELFAWAEIGVVSQDYSYIWQLEDGGYLLFSRGQSRLEVLTEELLPPKTTLTLLTDLPRGQLYTIINDFNRTSEDYRVEVAILGNDTFTPDRLQTQLIAGDGPDIFALYDRSSIGNIGDAAYENLLTYLDEDPEYSRDTIVPNLLTAMSTREKLSWLPYSFAISTFIAPSEYISASGVSFGEAESAASAAGLPLFPGWMTRDILWNWMSRFAVGQYMDAEADVCSFDSSGYIELLKQCASAAPELPEDTAVLYNSLLQFELLQNLTRLSAINDTYGGEYTFAGAPNDTTNGSMFTPDLCFAISSASENKEGSWQFVRTCLSEEHQLLNFDFLPSSAEVLDSMINDGVENGVRFFEFEYEIGEADADKLRELISETTTAQDTYPIVLSIMAEDAAEFFAGRITAEQAAEYTQNRVSTYLSERG